MGYGRLLREQIEEENDLNLIHIGNYQENKDFEDLNSVKSQSGTEKKGIIFYTHSLIINVSTKLCHF